MLDSGGGGGGTFTSGGGFDVEPVMILAGSAPLGTAADASTNYGLFAQAHASTAAGAAGEGPLAGVLGEFGGALSQAAADLATSLNLAASALERTAAAYEQSDGPLTGAP